MLSACDRLRPPRRHRERAAIRSGISGIFLAGALATGAASADSQAPPESWSGGTPAAYAQAIVGRTLARHPDLKIIAFHVTPPGFTTNVIVASNIGRIGKAADADDLAVIRTGAPHAEHTRTGYSVELVLMDASRRPIGALATTFTDVSGDGEPRIVERALDVRDEVAAQIPDLGELFAGVGTVPGR